MLLNREMSFRDDELSYRFSGKAGAIPVPRHMSDVSLPTVANKPSALSGALPRSGPIGCCAITSHLLGKRRGSPWLVVPWFLCFQAAGQRPLVFVRGVTRYLSKQHTSGLDNLHDSDSTTDLCIRDTRNAEHHAVIRGIRHCDTRMRLHSRLGTYNNTFL